MRAPLAIFALQLLLTSLISCQKQFEPTPSENGNFASAATFPLLLALGALSCSFYCCLHLYAQELSKALRWPTFPVNAVFFGLFILNVFFFIYDQEVSREMQAGGSTGHLRAYILGIPALYPSKNSFQGVKARSRAAQVLFDTMGRSITHWILLICFIVGTAGLFLLFCLLTRKQWIYAFYTQTHEQQLYADAIDSISNPSLINPQSLPNYGSNQQPEPSDTRTPEKCLVFNDCQQQKLRGRKLVLAVFTLMAVIDIVLFSVTAATKGPSLLAEAAPGNWNMLMSVQSYNMPEAKLYAAIQRERAENPLPDGLYYVDQRQTVQYPYIVGDYQTFCQFNDCSSREMVSFKTLPYNKEKNGASASNRLPNVVFVIIESFSPNPTFLNDPYNHIPFNNYQPFNASKLPQIARLASQGQTHYTVSTLGLPTIYGWHSLLTGHQPLQRGVNMAYEYKNEWFSLPKFFKMQGYTTSYTSPSPPEFDGKHNYLYKDKHFDYVQYGFPASGDDLPEPNSWVADRVTERQFEDYLESLYKLQQPFFATWMTVDMHTPFAGYDKQEYYDQSLEDDYERVAKYTDQYIGKLLDFLEAHGNNTLVVAIGDHGARERPLASKNPQLIDKSCTEKVFSDSYFLTSGIISYFGDDELIRSAIPKSTTVINSTDSNSFILQLELLISQLSERPFISNRFPSQVSNAHRVLEYRSHGRIYRSFANSKSNSQNFQSLPSCLKLSADMSTDLLREARELILLKNSLQAQNRMWNEGFVCSTEKCALPGTQKSNFVSGIGTLVSIFAVLIGASILVGWLATLSTWCWWRSGKRQKLCGISSSYY